jgi:hypothetical protein
MRRNLRDSDGLWYVVMRELLCLMRELRKGNCQPACGAFNELDVLRTAWDKCTSKESVDMLGNDAFSRSTRRIPV